MKCGLKEMRWNMNSEADNVIPLSLSFNDLINRYLTAIILKKFETNSSFHVK